MSARIAPLAVVMHILEPLFSSRIAKNRHSSTMLVRIALISMAAQNTMPSTEITTHTQVQVTVASLLPCLPQYRAPKIANTMLGSIDSMDTMVPNWMLPIRMPNIIVEMMVWLLTCWASLSATADSVYNWNGRLVARKWNISLRPTSSPPAVMPSKFSGLSTGVRPMQAISVSTQATAT